MKTKLRWCVCSWIKTGGKSGAILGMVLVMVVALSIVGLGLLQLAQVNSVEVARSYNLSKAFWAAEAGLSHAKAMLWNSSAFRSSPYGLPTSGTNLGYYVTTTPVGGGVYVLRSTGTVASASRVVWQTLYANEGPPLAFNYALFGGANSMSFKKAQVVIGDIYGAGPILFTYSPDPPAITGTVYDASIANINYTNGLTVAVPSPLPTFPVFDPVAAGYNTLISQASSGGTNLSSIGNFDLKGKTNYVNTSNLNVTGNLTGSGVLAVSGGVTLKSNLALSNNVSIISGGAVQFDFSTCTAGTNCLLYAKTSIDSIKDVTMGTITLITMGDIGPSSGGLNKNLTVTGAVYAAGAITTKKDLTVVGALLAGNGMTVGLGCTVTYTNLWPSALLNHGFNPEVQVTNLWWRQVF